MFYSLPGVLVCGQSAGTDLGHAVVRIAFYNAENYFDPYPDSTMSYNEFTPEGKRHWTKQKYFTKRQHIFKVIAALGEWQPVALMGFAEIENRLVLEELISETPLKNDGYRIVHFESHDHRGIDVGAIYLPSRMKLLHSHPIPITNKKRFYHAYP